jgi:hypothetical protein
LDFILDLIHKHHHEDEDEGKSHRRKQRHKNKKSKKSIHCKKSSLDAIKGSLLLEDEQQPQAKATIVIKERKPLSKIPPSISCYNLKAGVTQTTDLTLIQGILKNGDSQPFCGQGLGFRDNSPAFIDDEEDDDGDDDGKGDERNKRSHQTSFSFDHHHDDEDDNLFLGEKSLLPEKQKQENQIIIANNCCQKSSSTPNQIMIPPEISVTNHCNSNSINSTCSSSSSSSFLEGEEEEEEEEEDQHQHQHQHQQEVRTEVYAPSSSSSSSSSTSDAGNKGFEAPSSSSSSSSCNKKNVIQASTSDLLRAISCFVGRHFLTQEEEEEGGGEEVVIEWMRCVDRSLLVQGWQDLPFISPSNLVFVFLLLRRQLLTTFKKNQGSKNQVKSLLMSCLYLAYSFEGNEISYPLKPFLSEGQERDSFFDSCLKIIQDSSHEMLRINREASFFTRVFTDLLLFSPNHNHHHVCGDDEEGDPSRRSSLFQSRVLVQNNNNNNNIHDIRSSRRCQGDQDEEQEQDYSSSSSSCSSSSSLSTVNHHSLIHHHHHHHHHLQRDNCHLVSPNSSFQNQQDLGKNLLENRSHGLTNSTALHLNNNHNNNMGSMSFFNQHYSSFLVNHHRHHPSLHLHHQSRKIHPIMMPSNSMSRTCLESKEEIVEKTSCIDSSSLKVKEGKKNNNKDNKKHLLVPNFVS